MPSKIEVIAMHNKVHKGNYGVFISEQMWEEKCRETDELLAEIARLEQEATPAIRLKTTLSAIRGEAEYATQDNYDDDDRTRGYFKTILKLIDDTVVYLDEIAKG